MIMIRPSPAQKATKPPPPVPPRPSKTVVAEALAKSRHHNREAFKEATKGPTRQAPPPPPASAANEILKSKSTYSMSVNLKKPSAYERSVSEEVKTSARPVVYQSCNNSKVQIPRKDGDVKIVNRTDSFRNRNDVVQVVRRDSAKKSEAGYRPHVVSRRNSVKRDSFCDNDVKSAKKEKEQVLGETKEAYSLSNLSKSCESSEAESSSTHSSLEKRNWDKMLNDRNHVNTLIDEMFASVLEVQYNDEDALQIHSDFDKNGVSEDNKDISDTTKIVISNRLDATYENVKVENSVGIFDSKGEDLVPKTIIVIGSNNNDKDEGTVWKDKSCNNSNINSVERDKQVKFDDQTNHELLIKELQCMKIDQEKILKRQRKPSMNIYESVVPNSEDVCILERNGGFGETKLSTCHITINDVNDDKEVKKAVNLDYERITKMSSLHGLPPLPKSLSGFNLLESHQGPQTPVRSSSVRSSAQPGHLVYSPHSKVNGAGPDGSLSQLNAAGRKSTNLDAQLAILRREMYSLRQLDLSLLSQLWSLNESIQDFRQILQDQEDRVLSPPSPSPTPSSGEDADGDEFYMSANSISFRPAPPPPPVARRPSSSSNASSLG